MRRLAKIWISIQAGRKHRPMTHLLVVAVSMNKGITMIFQLNPQMT